MASTQEDDSIPNICKAKKSMKKNDKIKKIPKILGFFFYKDGLAQHGIQTQEGDGVPLDELLDTSQFSQYSEEDLTEALTLDDVKERFNLQERDGKLYIHAQPQPQNVSTCQQMAMDESMNACQITVDESTSHGEQSSKANSSKKKKKDRRRETEEALTDTSVYREHSQHDTLSRAPPTPLQGQLRSRGSAPDADVRLSKSLSYLLRHGAGKEGLTLLPGGYLYVDSILSLRKFGQWSLNDIRRVVDNNEKRRFHMTQDEATGRWMVRANQGHSIKVEGLDMLRIESAADYPVVVHGTYLSNWKSIKTTGLSRCTRNHIHFASGEPGDSGVISGMRKSCDIIIYLNLKRALEDGLEFYLSANNVILCSGNEQGYIHPRYFTEVYQRSPRQRIYPS